MGNRRNDEVITKPVLTVRDAAGATLGVALVLHGGRSHSYEPVEARHLSPARMVPFAKHLHRAGRKHGLAVWTLRNSVRGWNGPDMSPLQDARWALARIHDQHPGVPVYLLGHSMGGLTAICVADDPLVDAVVSLAPWLNAGTPADPVAGRKVLIVHGSADRWTSPAESLKFAQRAAAVADELRYVSLAGAGHFMIRRIRLWHTLATGFVLKAFGEAAGVEIGAGPARFDALLPATEPGTPVVL
ncbi:alpha/beta hydrolase [Arthrobacter oryzae]|uniref:alpha/beta hydrolase n=1 Tax=Arthrobacter oryzae TaxID=409290 RepID=UPI0027845FE9|nr:alpha/beta fold hydrolase [Arthrobacter oryzae]MDQ0077250.1 alpha-beta hydrolase superfamily lysophospholipase [Arthrobacter oryzae]